ncbi:hypothetical protein OVY01_05120 [Robbsia sp. Bb-Pol-6]|uniref:DUF5666 domain-containing protein n=1 Tax=Robbsia betulipollinis TaxID=2981849 RepID=A0ABT3ZL00_9BURK|nr:hypothetical protein [Robbsia betulipollinis]MCY0386628.1 hypothetical protein [Robbsia betulipollinis]
MKRSTQNYLVWAAVTLMSSPALAQPSEGQVATLTRSGVLFAQVTLRPDSLSLEFAACQPMKGAAVTVLGFQQKSSSAPGVSVARVRVLDGKCTGEEGWIRSSGLATRT